MSSSINNKDSIWQKFQIESNTRDLSWTEPSLIALAAATLRTHAQLPIQWVKLITNPSPTTLEIRLQDGRRWSWILHERMTDGLISYDLDNNTQWLRTDTIQYLIPLGDIGISVYVNTQVDAFDLRPV